jgi:hypothetical protein
MAANAALTLKNEDLAAAKESAEDCQAHLSYSCKYYTIKMLAKLADISFFSVLGKRNGVFGDDEGIPLSNPRILGYLKRVARSHIAFNLPISFPRCVTARTWGFVYVTPDFRTNDPGAIQKHRKVTKVPPRRNAHPIFRIPLSAPKRPAHPLFRVPLSVTVTNRRSQTRAMSFYGYRSVH